MGSGSEMVKASVLSCRSESSCLTRLIHVHNTSSYLFSASHLRKDFNMKIGNQRNQTEKELRKQRTEIYI